MTTSKILRTTLPFLVFFVSTNRFTIQCDANAGVTGMRKVAELDGTEADRGERLFTLPCRSTFSSIAAVRFDGSLGEKWLTQEYLR